MYDRMVLQESAARNGLEGRLASSRRLEWLVVAGEASELNRLNLEGADH